jgi:hypothetical protein
MARGNLRVSLAAVVFLAVRAHAGVIYTAIDLDKPDPNGGELWQYNYTFQNYVPQQNVAIEILFDPLLYTDLQNPPPAVSGWSIMTLQPDPNLPDPGMYSALALENNAPLDEPFTVTFGWLGQGSPGNQPVQINQFTSDGSFLGTLATDETSAVPEPATALLIGSALVAVALYLRWRLPSGRPLARHSRAKAGRWRATRA